MFTDTKSQTAIENDSAKENSLRFTRTVNQYFDGEELCFYADAEICEEHKKEFKRICKAVKNIGLERTRGLGAVRLDFEEDIRTNDINDCHCGLDPQSHDPGSSQGSCQARNDVPGNFFAHEYNFDGEQKYCVNYDIILNSPLMIPGVSNGETMEYISGTAILGALGAEYLKAKNLKEPDQDFENMFLKENENVIFGNAYLECSIPAPLFVQKLKETGDIRTVFSNEKTDKTPKPLKDAFICPDTFNKFDIETEISYHHSRGEESTLYTQKHLSAGQKFKGEIIGKGEYIKEIGKLLAGGLKIGRSKSAEYSDCSVANIAVNNCKNEMELKNGEDYVIALEADFVALDEYGNYSADIDTIFKATGIKGDVIKEKSYLTTRRNAGYNIAWNLKKPHFTAVKAGSYITFKYIGEDKNLERVKYYGEKNNEGFGKTRLYKLSFLEEFKFVKKADTGAKSGKILSEQYAVLKDKIDENDKNEDTRLSAIKFANDKKGCFTKDHINAAFVGRVALMINQSKDYGELERRVKSIKSESKREEILEIISKVEKNDNWREFLKVVFTLAKYWLKNEEKEVETK